MKALSVAQMKEAEQNAVTMGSTYLKLMEQAGEACAQYMLSQHNLLNQNVAILCGAGNNGGDGLVLARLLYRRGANITVLLCQGEPVTEESQENFRALPEDIEIITMDRWQLVLQMLGKARFVVDAVFGTGFHGEVDPLLSRLFDAVNHLGAPVYCIDIPSGLSGDSGEHSDSFLHASVTLALGAYKKVHLPEVAGNLCGNLVLLDIGIPAEAFESVLLDITNIDKEFAGKLLPRRNQHTNKGDYGKLLVVAGSVGMGGAAMMATKAALRSGAGITVLATPNDVAHNIAPQMMEAMAIPLVQNASGGVGQDALPHLEQLMEHSSALVLGCGMGQSTETRRLIKSLVSKAKIPLVLDADGINAITHDINMIKQLQTPVVLTPHPGELARLLGVSIADVERNRPKTALAVARNLHVVLVLKGHETLVALPNGTLYRNTTGNAGMAKGGSGDVLAGIIGALLAQKQFTAETAALLGVYLHGLAGDYCAVRYSQYSIIAGDLIDALPFVFKQTETATADPQEILSRF